MDTVEFSGNVLAHSGSAFNILGHDDTAASGQLAHLVIRDNLVLDINGSFWGGDGTFAQIGGEPADVTIDHNTIVHSGNVVIVLQRRLHQQLWCQSAWRPHHRIRLHEQSAASQHVRDLRVGPGVRQWGARLLRTGRASCSGT